MKVIHFYNGKGGGVQTLISNFINFKISSNIEYEIIYLLEKSNFNKYHKIPLKTNVKEHIFVYNKNWNFYYTLKKLSKLINDDYAILVAHDWLELGMVSQLRIPNPVIAFLHGNYDYYYHLYKKHSQHVNLFLSVTKTLINKISNDPISRRSSLVHYRYPVPEYNTETKKYDSLKILFIAYDLDESNKNFDFLPIIDSQLREKGVYVEWHIVGSVTSKIDIKSKFKINETAIKYYGCVLNHNLQTIYSSVNLIINCSFNEGLPVTVVEAMKCGIVPIVNNWNGSALELIENNVNGFIVSRNNPEAFVDLISSISQNKIQLLNISKNAFSIASRYHSCREQLEKYEKYLFEHQYLKNNNRPQKIYGSLLDNPFIPNFLVSTTRKILKRIYG